MPAAVGRTRWRGPVRRQRSIMTSPTSAFAPQGRGRHTPQADGCDGDQDTDAVLPGKGAYYWLALARSFCTSCTLAVAAAMVAARFGADSTFWVCAAVVSACLISVSACARSSCKVCFAAGSVVSRAGADGFVGVSDVGGAPVVGNCYWISAVVGEVKPAGGITLALQVSGACWNLA